jgi:hypothetical protein
VAQGERTAAAGGRFAGQVGQPGASGVHIEAVPAEPLVGWAAAHTEAGAGSWPVCTVVGQQLAGQQLAERTEALVAAPVQPGEAAVHAAGVVEHTAGAEVRRPSVAGSQLRLSGCGGLVVARPLRAVEEQPGEAVRALFANRYHAAEGQFAVHVPAWRRQQQ